MVVGDQHVVLYYINEKQTRPGFYEHYENLGQRDFSTKIPQKFQLETSFNSTLKDPGQYW